MEYQVLLIDFHVYHRTKIQYGFVPMSKMPQFLNASSSFFLRDEPHTQCMRDQAYVQLGAVFRIIIEQFQEETMHCSHTLRETPMLRIFQYSIL